MQGPGTGKRNGGEAVVTSGGRARRGTRTGGGVSGMLTMVTRGSVDNGRGSTGRVVVG